MIRPEEADIVKTVLQEALPRECIRVGKSKVNDIALRGGDVSFIPVPGARFELRSDLETLASAATVVSYGFTVAKSIINTQEVDPKTLAPKISELIPKAIADRVDDESLRNRLIEALARQLLINHYLPQKALPVAAVLAWGLLPDELETVYQFARPEEVQLLTAAPQEKLIKPLLVGLNALSELIAWSDQQQEITGSRPYPVLLSLLSGAEEPDGVWESYDGIITSHDLKLLQRIIQCAQVLEAELAATDVPAGFLQDLRKPISLYRMAEIPFDDPDWNKADSTLRQHLAICSVCRRAFNERLTWRINMPKQLMQKMEG